MFSHTNSFLDHPAVYYRTVQPYQAHSRIPAADRWVYCYAFGLKPEELLHTGSVNMSRMDNASLRITYNTNGDTINPAIAGQLFVFARNKNVMKACDLSPFFQISKLTLVSGHRWNGWSQVCGKYLSPAFIINNIILTCSLQA